MSLILGLLLSNIVCEGLCPALFRITPVESYQNFVVQNVASRMAFRLAVSAQVRVSSGLWLEQQSTQNLLHSEITQPFIVDAYPSTSPLLCMQSACYCISISLVRNKMSKKMALSPTMMPSIKGGHPSSALILFTLLFPKTGISFTSRPKSYSR
jgi:hypothetical protein